MDSRGSNYNLLWYCDLFKAPSAGRYLQLFIDLILKLKKFKFKNMFENLFSLYGN